MAGIFDLVTPEDIARLKAQQQQVVPRNMKQVGPAMREIFGERVPNAALEGPAAAGGEAAKRGLLSRFMSVAGGPVSTGAQAALYSPELNTGEDQLVADRNSQERQANMNANPESAMDASRYAADLSRRTLDAGLGRSGGTPSPYAMDYKAPEAAPAQDKEALAQQVAQERQATETKRQVVEQGAVEALRTNQISRPQLAQEVVQADLARKGQTATPDELKGLVQTETAQMRTMDNKDLSKYVSYALIAGGLAAAFMDKSGKSGDAFTAGMNKQLDRNLVQAKMAASQKAAENKNAIDLYKLKQGDRGLAVQEAGAENDATRTKGQLGYWADSAQTARDRVGVAREANSVAAQNANANIGLKNAQLELNQGLFQMRKENADRDYALNERKTAATEARAEAAGGLKAPDMSLKDATDMVTQRSKETGISLSKGAAPQVAAALRILIKDDPGGFATNPEKFYDAAIASSNLEKTGNTDWYNNRSYRVKKEK